MHHMYNLECLMVFLAYFTSVAEHRLGGFEGFLRCLSRFISFDVPDYTIVCRRVNRVTMEIRKTLTLL